MIRPRHLIATAVLAGAFTAPGCMSQAFAVSNCGGQSAPPQPVPYQCNLPGIDITAQGQTRHFAAVLNADGTHVTVQWIMTGGVLPVPVPIQMIHHIGISGAGGPETQASGVIPAGQTTATLSVTSPCFAGQVDIWAVSTGPNFRVGGPWIQNGTGCNETTTSTTTTPSSSTVPPPVDNTSIPTTTPGQVESTAPTTGGGTHSKTTLPPTGPQSLGTFLWLIPMALFAGAVAILATRRRAS